MKKSIWRNNFFILKKWFFISKKSIFYIKKNRFLISKHRFLYEKSNFRYKKSNSWYQEINLTFYEKSQHDFLYHEIEKNRLLFLYKNFEDYLDQVIIFDIKNIFDIKKSISWYKKWGFDIKNVE